jgi:hypothetical protein
VPSLFHFVLPVSLSFIHVLNCVAPIYAQYLFMCTFTFLDFVLVYMTRYFTLRLVLSLKFIGLDLAFVSAI